MKIYLLFFHFIMGTFIAGGFLIAMSTFFTVPWAQKLKDLTVPWEKLSPFAIVLFLPLFFFGKTLIPFPTHQDHKIFYFSSAFLLFRIVLMSAAIWIGARLMRTMPVVTLVLYFVTGTFIAIDWAMALETHWTSNIYGLIYLLNFALVFFAGFLFFRGRSVDEKSRKDLIHVLITLTIMWGYLHYAQFIILWMGNKPSEVKFYLMRNYPLGLMAPILCLKFLPVLSSAFLPERKGNLMLMKTLSVLVVAAGWLELHWLLNPTLWGTR